MSFHSDLFGWEYVWRNFADGKGGEVLETDQGGILALMIPAPDIDSTVVLMPSVKRGKRASKGTTVAVTFKPVSDFGLVVHAEKLSDQVGKVFGMQDVQVNDAEFDSKFLIQGTNESIIKKLFADARLRESLLLQPPTELRIETDLSRLDLAWTVPAGHHALVYRTDRHLEKFDQLQLACDVVTIAATRLVWLRIAAGKPDPAARDQLSSELEASCQSTFHRLHSPLLDRS